MLKQQRLFFCFLLFGVRVFLCMKWAKKFMASTIILSFRLHFVWAIFILSWSRTENSSQVSCEWDTIQSLFAFTGIVNIWLNYLVNAFYCINDNKKKQRTRNKKIWTWSTLRSHFTHSPLYGGANVLNCKTMILISAYMQQTTQKDKRNESKKWRWKRFNCFENGKEAKLNQTLL